LNKLAIPLFLLSTACSFSFFAPYAHSAESDETWWITPRYGFSTSTALIGIELQVDHVALAGGTILFASPTCGCNGNSDNSMWTYAVKYYFNRFGDSWSLSLFSLGLSSDFRINGIGADYRWRVGSRWDLSAGMGFGSDGHLFGPVPSFAAGYSF
jgi:hypothetical protein